MKRHTSHKKIVKKFIDLEGYFLNNNLSKEDLKDFNILRKNESLFESFIKRSNNR